MIICCSLHANHSTESSNKEIGSRFKRCTSPVCTFNPGLITGPLKELKWSSLLTDQVFWLVVSCWFYCMVLFVILFLAFLPLLCSWQSRARWERRAEREGVTHIRGALAENRLINVAVDASTILTLDDTVMYFFPGSDWFIFFVQYEYDYIVLLVNL